MTTRGPRSAGLGRARRGRGVWGPSYCPPRAGAGDPPGPCALCALTLLLLLLGAYSSSNSQMPGHHTPCPALSHPGTGPCSPDSPGWPLGLLSDVLSSLPCPRCLLSSFAAQAPPPAPNLARASPVPRPHGSQKHPRDVLLPWGQAVTFDKYLYSLSYFSWTCIFCLCFFVKKKVIKYKVTTEIAPSQFLKGRDPGGR